MKLTQSSQHQSTSAMVNAENDNPITFRTDGGSKLGINGTNFNRLLIREQINLAKEKIFVSELNN